MNMQEEFFNYIMERQRIWNKRFITSEPGPWTNDPILQKYKFCNVYRYLDPGSVEVKQRIAFSYELTLPEKIFNIVLYRRFNSRSFFQNNAPVKFITFSEQEFIGELDWQKNSGVKLFSDAYTICQIPYDKYNRPKDKHAQVIMSMNDLISEKFFECIAELSGAEAKYLFNALQPDFPKPHGIGPFLAYQIMQDLEELGHINEFHIKGMDDFVYVGPGAIPGLVMIHGNADEPEEQCRQLREIQGVYLKDDWKEITMGDLRLCDIQANLCEFRKYTNLKNNPRKCRKRLFKGGK